jgi:outer membrane protein assembly factor BamB
MAMTSSGRRSVRKGLPKVGGRLAPAAAGTLVLALALLLAPGVQRTARASSPEAVSVAFDVNAAHDGDQPNQSFSSPVEKWSVDFGNMVGYPVIVGGRVFVTVAIPGQNGDGPNYDEVYALNASNGSVAWGPVQIGTERGGSASAYLAYDNGRVFVVDGNGLMLALDPATGQQEWSTAIDGYGWFVDAPPTAIGGTIYVDGAGTGARVFALSESDGSILWQTQLNDGGDFSSPAVSSTGVYVSYAANQTYDLDPATGAVIWQYAGGDGDGGGGNTPALHNGDLYVRNADEEALPQYSQVLDAATGVQVGDTESVMPPAFDGTLEFSVSHWTIAAIDTSTGDQLWSHTTDGLGLTPPFVVGGNVYVGDTSGALTSYDERTGAQTWSTNLGSPVSAPIWGNLQPVMEAGDGLLVVPATDTLVAFTSGQSGSTPPGGGTTSTTIPPGSGTTPTTTATSAPMPTPPTTTGTTTTGSPGGGYTMAASDGGIFTFGNVGYYGSEGGTPLNQPIVGIARTPDGQGYWEVASDGGIFNYGDAEFFGSQGGKPLNKPIVSIAATPDGQGYWEVASDGGIFSFGDAKFYGSQGGKPLNKPIVGIAATPDGQGYWEVASDGGVFNYGDAQFYGSQGGKPLNKPIVGIAATPDGQGYWQVASDGGIFSFGDAKFFGSQGGKPLNKPIVGIAATPDGQGYWEVANDGGIFNYGDAQFYGSQGGKPLDQPIIGLMS